MPPWKRRKPAGKGKKSKLSPQQIEAARRRAAAAGRRYPNLVDNMWAVRHVPARSEPAGILEALERGCD